MLPKSRCVLDLYLGAARFVRTWGSGSLSHPSRASVVSGSDGRRVDGARKWTGRECQAGDAGMPAACA